MKKLNTLALGTLMVPVLTFGAGAAMAQQTGTGEYRSPTEQSRQQGATGQHGATGQQGMQGRAGEHAGAKDYSKQKGEYLSSTPMDATRADDLIGTNLRSSVGDDEIGSVSDLLIDRDGQVVAVVADVGGFLGMGSKTVAIPWDSIERELGDDGEEQRFTVNATEDALRDAPEYEGDE